MWCSSMRTSFPWNIVIVWLFLQLTHSSFSRTQHGDEDIHISSQISGLFDRTSRSLLMRTRDLDLVDTPPHDKRTNNPLPRPKLSSSTSTVDRSHHVQSNSKDALQLALEEVFEQSNHHQVRSADRRAAHLSSNSVNFDPSMLPSQSRLRWRCRGALACEYITPTLVIHDAVLYKGVVYLFNLDKTSLTVLSDAQTMPLPVKSNRRAHAQSKYPVKSRNRNSSTTHSLRSRKDLSPPPIPFFLPPMHAIYHRRPVWIPGPPIVIVNTHNDNNTDSTSTSSISDNTGTSAGSGRSASTSSDTSTSSGTATSTSPNANTVALSSIPINHCTRTIPSAQFLHPYLTTNAFHALNDGTLSALASVVLDYISDKDQGQGQGLAFFFPPKLFLFQDRAHPIKTGLSNSLLWREMMEWIFQKHNVVNATQAFSEGYGGSDGWNDGGDNDDRVEGGVCVGRMTWGTAMKPLYRDSLVLLRRALYLVIQATLRRHRLYPHTPAPELQVVDDASITPTGTGTATGRGLGQGVGTATGTGARLKEGLEARTGTPTRTAGTMTEVGPSIVRVVIVTRNTTYPDTIPKRKLSKRSELALLHAYHQYDHKQQQQPQQQQQQQTTSTTATTTTTTTTPAHQTTPTGSSTTDEKATTSVIVRAVICCDWTIVQSLPQLLSYFGHADIIVGAHGAGLTNTFLAPPGIVLAELQDYGYGFTHFAMLAHATGGGYLHVDARDLPVTPKGQAGAGAELSQHTVNEIVRKTMMLHRKIKRKQQQQQQQQQPQQQRRFNSGTGSGGTKHNWSFHNVINIKATAIDSVINEFDNHNDNHQSDSAGTGKDNSSANPWRDPSPGPDPSPDASPNPSPSPVCAMTVLSDPLPLLLTTSSQRTTTDSVDTSADIRRMIYGPRYTSPSPDADSPGASAFSPGTNAFSPGTSAFSPGTSAFSLVTDAFSPGTNANSPSSSADSPGTNAFSPGTNAFNPGTNAFSPGTDAFNTGTNATNALCRSLPYQHMRSKLLAPSQITPLPVKSPSQITPRPVKSSQIGPRPVKPPSQNIDPKVDPFWCDRWYTPGSLLWTPGDRDSDYFLQQFVQPPPPVKSHRAQSTSPVKSNRAHRPSQSSDSVKSNSGHTK